MSILNLEGAYENELSTAGEFNPQAAKTALMLPSGQRIVLPTEVLLAAMGGSAAESAAGGGILARSAAKEQMADTGASAKAITRRTPEQDSHEAQRNKGQQVIPLVEEEMLVGKTLVETGRVRVRRETEEHMQTVSVPLTDVRWEVEHVPIEQVVETQPEIRQVGETIIFPLVEERLVVKRELWLREEVHVRKVATTVEKSADFPVKRDVLVEERTGVAEQS